MDDLAGEGRVGESVCLWDILTELRKRGIIEDVSHELGLLGG